MAKIAVFACTVCGHQKTHDILYSGLGAYSYCPRCRCTRAFKMLIREKRECLSHPPRI